MNFKYRSSHRWYSLNLLKVRNIYRKTSVLESLFNKFIGPPPRLATLLKRGSNTGISLWILQTLKTPFEKDLRTADSDSSYILHRKLNKNIQEADWPSRLAFCFSRNVKSLYFTYFHSYSFVLSLAVLRCHSLSFFVTRCHSLSLAAPPVVTRWITRCHSLYHSMSLVVSRCHSLYHLFSFVVTGCHSMSLDEPLCCLFTNDHYFISFCFLHHL